MSFGGVQLVWHLVELSTFYLRELLCHRDLKKVHLRDERCGASCFTFFAFHPCFLEAFVAFVVFGV